MDLNQAPAHVKALGDLIVNGMAPNFNRLEELLSRMCETAGKPGGGAPGGGGGCAIPNSAGNNSVIQLMQQVMRERCDLMYSQEDIARVAEAIKDGSWQLYKDQVGRSEMSFQLTNAVGTGQSQTTPLGNTIFVAGPTIAASRSLLLMQDMRYGLPWRPGCLDVDINPAEGVSNETAYKNILVTAWVALKTDIAGLNTTNPANPVGYYGVRWNDYQVIRGKELYCGDSCKKVALRGPCVDGDWVGKDAILLLQIDNLDTSNSITFRNAEVDFKHIKKICCEDCFNGATSCSCGGG